jgi:hypothetical protein
VTTEVAPPAPTRLATQPPARLDRVVAWVLLAGLVVTYASAVVLGERRVEVSDLRNAIGSGEVTEVRTSDDGITGIGYGPVTIRWEQHGITYVTDVTQASSEWQARKVDRPPDEVVVGDVATALRTNGRQVTSTATTEHSYGTSTQVLGFEVHGAFFVINLVITCATLLLIGAREPWRATRWAWAWLVLLTPVGVPAFLVLGGSTGLLRPRMPHRRLTAGWAFLLALLIFTPGS